MLEEMFIIFADEFKSLFPTEDQNQRMDRAYNLYSGLVGTLTMVRTLKDQHKALQILEAGKLSLKQSIYQV